MPSNGKLIVTYYIISYVYLSFMMVIHGFDYCLIEGLYLTYFRKASMLTKKFAGYKSVDAQWYRWKVPTGY